MRRLFIADKAALATCGPKSGATVHQAPRSRPPLGSLTVRLAPLLLAASTWSLALAQAPTNDLFEGRLLLDGLAFNFDATNTFATREDGEKDYWGAPPVQSLWWVWRSSKDGYAVVDTSSSPTRTRVAVYDEQKHLGLLHLADSLNLSGLANRPDRYEFNIRNSLDVNFSVDGWQDDSGEIRLSMKVYTKPEILVDPPRTNLIAGWSYTNTVIALGKLPMTYHWQMRPLGATGSFTNRQVSASRDLVLDVVRKDDEGWYQVIVTNDYGAVTSKVALVQVDACATPNAPQPPLIVTNVGKTAAFSASADGTPPFKFQWQFKPENLYLFSELPGATAATLTLTNLSTDDAGEYRFRVWNEACPTKTNNLSTQVTLVVTTNNSLVLDPNFPKGLNLITNEDATFEVRVTEGYQPIHYQWWFQPAAGTARSLLAEIAPTLAKPGVKLSDAGRYWAVVSNRYALVTSTQAVLTVETRPPNDNFDRRIPVFPGWTNLSTVKKSETNVFGWNKNGTPEPGEKAHQGRGPERSVWWSFQAPVEGHVIVALSTNLPSGGVLAAYNGATVSDLVAVVNRATNRTDLFDFVCTTNLEYFFAVEAPAGGYRTNNLGLDFIFDPNLGAPTIWLDLDKDADPLLGEMDGAGPGCRKFADFEVEAISLDGVVNYQWQFGTSTNDASFVDLEGQTNSTLVIPNVTTAHQGWYRARVSNRSASVYSKVAYLPVVVGPQISRQPDPVSTNACTAARFEVEAASCSPMTYQWYQNGQPVIAPNAVGAQSSVLRLLSLGPWNEGLYHVLVSNAHAAVASTNVPLTLTNTPTITKQPQDVTNSACQDASFSVSAWADCPLTYEWFFNRTNLVGTSSNLTLAAVGPAQAGSYLAVVSTPYGHATSRVAQLVVRIEPVIRTQPTGTNANLCDNVILDVSVAPEPEACPELAYQWQFEGANLANATNHAYEFYAKAASAGDYWVIVSNRWTSVTSTVATVNVDARPLIVTQPPPTLRSKAGGSFEIGLTVWTCEELHYLWQFKPVGGTNFTDVLPGPRYLVATNGWLTVRNGRTNDSGSYRVVVSNLITGVTSSNAVVRVVAPPLNDNFADGFSLGSVAPAFGTGHNEYATAEPAEPSHAGLPATNSVWWSWTNPAPALVTVDLAGSDIDTLLGVYAGSEVSQLTRLAQSDDGRPDGTSVTSFMAGPGAVLHFAIDGKDRAQGSTQGTSQGTNLMIAVTAIPIQLAPVITNQPLSQAARDGETVSFSTKCYGSPDIAIQWYGKNEALASDPPTIVDLTNYLSVLTLTNVSASDQGVYYAVLSNSVGTNTTRKATLTFGSVVRGMVSDATKTTPTGAAIGIEGVRVSVGEVSDTTDANGNYELAGVKVGELRADFMADKTRVHLSEPIQFWNRSTLTAALLIATKTNYYDYIDDQFEVGKGQSVEKWFSMSPVFQGLRFVLNWTNKPADLDLALRLPDTIPVDSHWIDYLPQNKGSTSQPPYAIRDADVAQGWGPETITIHQFYPGTYSVYALKYPGQGVPWLSQSSAQVVAYLGHDIVPGLSTQLRPLATIGVPPLDSTNEWWHVCDVDGLTTNITWIDQLVTAPAGAGGGTTPGPAAFAGVSPPRAGLMSGPPGGVDFEWDFGDGSPRSNLAEPIHSYAEPGWKTVSLRVTERTGNPPKSAFTNKIDYIYVENLPPTITIINPPPDTIFRARDPIALESKADGIDDPMKEVEYYLQEGARRTLLGTVREPPYTFLFPNRDYLDTTYTFVAQARDLHDATSWSDPVTVRVADLRGDILIIRNFPSVEIETMRAFLADDLGEVIPDQDTDGSMYYRRPKVKVLDQEGLHFELVQDFKAIIWDDQGTVEGGLTPNDVAVLQQAYEKGIPLYLIGEQLGASRERLIDDTLSSYYQWTGLLGFEAVGTIAGPLEIHGIQNTDEDGLFYGCYNDGPDPSTIIPYAASVERAELTSEQMEVIAEVPIPAVATNSSVMLRYPRFDAWDFGQTRRLVQNFRVVGDRTPAPPEDEASSDDRRKLFLNGVCWLLRLFQAQEVNVTVNCLKPVEGEYVGSVGQPMVFVARISQNGADTAGGVLVTNYVSPRLLPESAEVVPVVATAPTNTYQVEVGTNFVVARFAQLRRGQVYELRTTVIPRFRGWATNEYSVVRGLYEWSRCQHVAFIEGPACVGPLQLTLYLDPYNDLRLRVSGATGCLLQLQSSTDLRNWRPQASLEPTDDSHETTLGHPSGSMRYYRIVALD